MKRGTSLALAVTVVALLSSTATAAPIVLGPPTTTTRVILLHGLDGTPESMLTSPYNLLTDALARRYQVIVPHEPYDQLAAQSAGDLTWFAHDPTGSAYASRWVTRFERLAAWSRRHYGAKRLVVVGISWGGMHALLAACRAPDVAAFAVSSPVVDPNSLTEFAGLPELWALNPNLNGCARRLNEMPGFIGWGDADTRVGIAPVQRLLSALPAARSCRYHGLGHVSNAQTEANMVRALDGQRPVGCST